MKVKINDNRTNNNSECEVFTYGREEKATNLVFDYQEQVWRVWTSIPEHITKLLKLKKHNLVVDSVSETGTITAIRGTLPRKTISFRNIIELSEERKAQLKENAKNLHKK